MMSGIQCVQIIYVCMFPTIQLCHSESIREHMAGKCTTHCGSGSSCHAHM